MFGTIGPKTIASIIGGLALIGLIVWVWITIVDLRADKVALTAANAQLTSDLSTAKSVNDANVKALSDLKTAYADQQKALLSAQADLATSQTQTQTIVTKVIHAAPSDKACFAPALAAAFAGLYAQAPANGSDPNPGGKGQAKSGLPIALSGLAAHNAGLDRLEVTVRPAK